MFSEQLAWHQVSSNPQYVQAPANVSTVKIPKPKETEDEGGEAQIKPETENVLPQTLVRIPTEHAPMLQPAGSGGGSGE